jgi:hypothetical protein
MGTKGIDMRRFAKVLLHLAIIGVVLMTPPLVYDAVSRFSWRTANGLAFSGGLVYPVYFGYWICQLKSVRAKCLWGYTLGLIAASMRVFGMSDRSTSFVVLLIPAIIGAIPIALSIVTGIMRNRPMAIIWLFTTLIVLPLGVLISMLATYGAAVATLGNMRLMG